MDFFVGLKSNNDRNDAFMRYTVQKNNNVSMESI